MKLKKKNIIFILCLGFVLGINIYLRCFPVYFPQLKIQARNIVEDVIQRGVTNDTYKKFPQFFPQAKEAIAKSRAYEYKKQNRKAIRDQANDLYHKLKDRFQDDSGQTYLMELDCWHWGRYVDNVVRFGHPGDEVIYGRQWDLLMLAPHGMYLNWEQFLYYFAAYLYKFFSIVGSVPLFTFLFYLPLFFSAVFITVLYLFSRRLGGNIAAVTSSLFIGLSPIFLQRSCAGWFDRDILNLLFPLLIIWTYLLSYRSHSLMRRLFWIFFMSFLVGLFCFTWTQWWFIFLIIAIYEIISLGCLIFSSVYFKKSQALLIKERIISLLSFLVFSFLWIILFSGNRPLIVLYDQIKRALVLNKPLMSSIWPNVYYTVGELKGTSMAEIAYLIWGKLVFITSLICMVVLLIRALWGHSFDNFRRACIVILAIWFVSMSFASLRGVRFVVFLLVPLGISLGWAMNETFSYFRNKKNILGIVAVAAVFIVFSVGCVRKGYQAAATLYPLIDDNWYKVLNIIKEKTPEQTIVNSWWDFGDWFKTVARRRVIFDGQTQEYPQAYWMAKAILTNNEEEAIRILRMLNNGGNEAFEIINKYIPDPLESVLFLESLLVLEPLKVQNALLLYLPSSAAEEVFKLIFNKPSTASFVVEYTMLPKMPAISYLGNWDFSKVYIAQKFNKEEKNNIIEYLEKMGRNNESMQKFYQEAFLITPQSLDEWLSHRLQFYSGVVAGNEKDGVIFFDNGFIYNPKDNSIRSNAGHIPRSLFVLLGDNFTEVVYPNANVIFSVLVIKEEKAYKCILMDRELAGSMLVRLYFFNGLGLRHFIPFIEAEEGSNYIRVFNIAW